jgi:hypothetical protein
MIDVVVFTKGCKLFMKSKDANAGFGLSQPTKAGNTRQKTK